MPGIAVRLEEWRSAERRRGALPRGSPAFMAADEDVRRAQAAYRGEARQVEAYYAELDFAAHDRSFPRWLAGIDRAATVNRSPAGADGAAARAGSGAA